VKSIGYDCEGMEKQEQERGDSANSIFEKPNDELF
jgi:hypothetical protein